MKIFIVIPAFNEEERILSVISDVERSGLPIIVVDDGSTDTTSQKLRGASKTFKNRLRVLRHKVNLGKGAAMKTGAEAAFLKGADAVIIMDSDGQHKTDDLPHFIAALKKGKFEVVFGARNFKKGVPLVRHVGNKVASFFVYLLFGIFISDLICGYRALTKKAYKRIDWQSTGYAVETEMVIKTGKFGLKHCQVPVQTVYLSDVKGVTIFDALNILFDVLRWRIKL